MTYVVEHQTNENYYIELALELRTHGYVYIVRAYPRLNGDSYGYPEREITYPSLELKKASATFKRYCKKYI